MDLLKVPEHNNSRKCEIFGFNDAFYAEKSIMNENRDVKCRSEGDYVLKGLVWM